MFTFYVSWWDNCFHCLYFWYLVFTLHINLRTVACKIHIYLKNNLQSSLCRTPHMKNQPVQVLRFSSLLNSQRFAMHAELTPHKSESSNSTLKFFSSYWGRCSWEACLPLIPVSSHSVRDFKDCQQIFSSLWNSILALNEVFCLDLTDLVQSTAHGYNSRQVLFSCLSLPISVHHVLFSSSKAALQHCSCLGGK